MLLEVGFVLVYPFPVSLDAFALHRPISDKSERQKSRIPYKGCVWERIIGVAAEERGAQSLWEVLGLPPPCQTAAANEPIHAQVLTQARRPSRNKQRTDEKAKGIAGGDRRKSKDVGHEEIAGEL